jgi:hypothetical protein
MRKIALEADKFRLYFKKGTIPPRKSADFRFESPLGWIGSGGQPNALQTPKCSWMRIALFSLVLSQRRSPIGAV